MTDIKVIFSGTENPPITDQIKVNSIPYDLTSSTVRFKARYANSSDLKIDETAGIEDYDLGKVYYNWTDSDTDEPGEFFGWWEVSSSGATLSTDEFSVIVTKHSPGLRTETGAIYQHAKSKIPVTWVALEEYKNYGDALLQQTIETVKLDVFAASVPVANEKTYDLRIQEYIAKLAVLKLIPAGIDYWASQYETVSAQGGPATEIASYPNRIEALKVIQEHLLIEVAKDRAKIEELLGVSQTIPSYAVPGVSDGGGELEGFVTPNPNTHFIDYAFPGRRAGRYWGNNW